MHFQEHTLFPSCLGIGHTETCSILFLYSHCVFSTTSRVPYTKQQLKQIFLGFSIYGMISLSITYLLESLNDDPYTL